MNITSSTVPPSEGSSVERDLLTSMVILSVFSLLGIIGNALAFYIYYQKRDKSTSTLFILALAVVDFVACLIVIPYTVVVELLEYMIYSEFLCKSYLFVITCNTPLSAVLLVAIGVDRYFCICHPFRHVITQRRAKIIILLLTIFAFALGLLTSLTFGIHVQEDVANVTEAANLTHAVTDDVTGARSSLANVTTFLHATTQAYNASTSPFGSDEAGNVTESGSEYEQPGFEVGQCVPSDRIIGPQLRDAIQKFHVGLFLVSLIILAVIYVFIYRSILVRRAWRMKRKRMSCYTSVNGHETQIEETTLTGVNNGNGPHHHHSHIDKTKVNRKNSAKLAAAIREKNLYANIKTAAMLFVVTVVFIFSFLPTWLMILRVIPTNIIIHNLYFFNNVANPFIYAFMNRSFRDDLKQLVQSCPQKADN